MALFQQPVRPAGAVQVEFRAGQMEYDGRMLKADKKKGKVVLSIDEEQMTHLQWLDREKNEIVIDLIVVNDAYLERIEKCTTGRVYICRFTSSDKKLFFWMQEPKAEGDAELIKKFNDTIGAIIPEKGATPVATSGGATGAAAAATSAPVAPALPVAAAGGDPNLNQTLAAVLQQMAAGQGAQVPQQAPVLLGDMFEKEDLLCLLEDPEAVAELKENLAAGAEQTDEELRQTLVSPQVSGSMKQLSQVIYSDQVFTLFAAMGLDSSFLRMGGSPMQALVRALEAKWKKD